ncbi:MAG: hypothetical protein JSU63_17880 [Phycisphaerales bacterium]|nr:MAG: hypothetical protein JSU63_17880 [Phycisphaerales bacterium]
MGESDLHRKLKRAACRWLWDAGYAAISEEVRVPGVGIVDVAALGRWRRHNPRRVTFQREPTVDRSHAVFVECKAMRADFIRDQGRQHQFAFALKERGERYRAGRPRRARHASPALGKFDSCLLRPHANLHYLLTPPRLIRSGELPRRWGWLVFDQGNVRVVRKPTWQEVADVTLIEGAIAQALTARRMRAWQAYKPTFASEQSHTRREVVAH